MSVFKRGHYPVKTKRLLEEDIRFLCNRFKVDRLTAIRFLQDVLNDMEQTELGF